MSHTPYRITNIHVSNSEHGGREIGDAIGERIARDMEEAQEYHAKKLFRDGPFFEGPPEVKPTRAERAFLCVLGWLIAAAYKVAWKLEDWKTNKHG